ncbi:hypothetical protein QC763_101300 [Podospora pseudopauciseta]|uniref:Uncharacterized protein n=1 Tax=Podospora pseudopauciseta TaxID=2093780 RepID=A0ABR0HWU4_9PEZI|nr:hypothetical protein QC763_101300 [Podospora pseudopauciseta]
MATTTTETINTHKKTLPLSGEYWAQFEVPLSLRVPRTPGPNQTEMPSKRFSIPRFSLQPRDSSSSLSDATSKPTQKKEKMRHDNLPPLVIPRRNSSHQALLLQLQVISVPGAVTLKKTSSDQSIQKRQPQRPHQPPYQHYQHERVYNKPATDPSSQRVSSAQCPVIRPVPIPIPDLPPVPPVPLSNYPPNSSTTRRLSQVIKRARSRSKSRDRRKSTKPAEPIPETPFLASAPYGTGNKLNPGAPFLNDAPIVVEPETPFLALRLERNMNGPSFEDDDFLAVMSKGGKTPPDSAMTMGSFLSQYKYPPVTNQQRLVQSPIGYGEGEDARAVLPSQSPKKGSRDSEWVQKEKALKRSSAVCGGVRSLNEKDGMSPRVAGNGFSAGGGRPVSLPPWSKILPTGPRKSGEVNMAEMYARMDPESGHGARGQGREKQLVEVNEEKAERMDSFNSVIYSETCVAHDLDGREEWRRSRAVSQKEPEQELVDEFGEREKDALKELLEYMDSILGPTDNPPMRSGARCIGGDWSKEQSWWRDVRRSLQ